MLLNEATLRAFVPIMVVVSLPHISFFIFHYEPPSLWVFQQAELLYGTVSQNGRGSLMIKSVHWPIVLSLLLDRIAANFARYKVLTRKERITNAAQPTCSC